MRSIGRLPASRNSSSRIHPVRSMLENFKRDATARTIWTAGSREQRYCKISQAWSVRRKSSRSVKKALLAIPREPLMNACLRGRRRDRRTKQKAPLCAGPHPYRRAITNSPQVYARLTDAGFDLSTLPGFIPCGAIPVVVPCFILFDFILLGAFWNPFLHCLGPRRREPAASAPSGPTRAPSLRTTRGGHEGRDCKLGSHEESPPLVVMPRFRTANTNLRSRFRTLSSQCQRIDFT